MQKTEIYWSPNDRNQLAEIGAEIIVHTFDRPLSGESGKCLSGGFNKKTTSLNYPLNEKNHIKCCAWWPSKEYPYVFAIGQPSGRIIFENVQDRSDPWSQERIVIDSKQSRSCVALAWNPRIPTLLLSGFDKCRSENCLTIWDINHNNSSIGQSLNTNNNNNDEYKRVDMLTHHQQIWKAYFEHGMNEQCHSLSWFQPNQRLFAACTTSHSTRAIRIYDPRASSPCVLTLSGKAPFNLCVDSTERYLASTIDKTVHVYDTRLHDKALIIREEQEPIVKICWSRVGPSQLGYCIRDSPKFHLLSLITNNSIQDHDSFLNRILQCPIQRYRIGLASFDWNYYDEDRLVLLGGKEYFDYVIPSKSMIYYSTRNGLLWSDGHQFKSSILSNDQIQISSKVMFNYDLNQTQVDRRNYSSIRLNDKIELNFNEINKETRTIIESFQRAIKNSNQSRDSYPFIGVIDLFRENQTTSTTTMNGVTSIPSGIIGSSSSNTINSFNWLSTLNSTIIKTVYDSSERQHILQLCGWINSFDSKINSQLIYDRINSLIDEDQYEKAAAIYMFQMNIQRALEVLNLGFNQRGREDLGTLMMALIGLIQGISTNIDEKNLFNNFSSIIKSYQNPYLRAMFGFIITPNGNDLQYQCVLDEQLDLNDKVAFAARYLNDQRLNEKFEKLAEESREKGDLQGILLTGLRQAGCELIQRYLDQTNDIRTVAFFAIYVSEEILQDCSYVQEWIEGYRLLLDQLQLWNERAEFDIFRHHLNDSTTLTRRSYFNYGQNSFSFHICIFCQNSLENISNLTTNPNSSSITTSSTTQIKSSIRSSQSNLVNRSSSSNYTTNSNSSELLNICNKCRLNLPRCSICMMNLTTYIEDASYAYEPIPDKHTLMSSQWFTWCRLCRHGGHAEHVSNWFSMNDKCPIARCSCRCTSIDGIFSSS